MLCLLPESEVWSGSIDAAPSKIFSPEDGWLDVSGFLDEAYGFVPLVIPITEPAVGYGAAGALVFIDKAKEKGATEYARPNISFVGGMRTENGTRGAFAGDLRHWLDDRLQTLVGLVEASVNLDFYGIGADRALRERPLAYNLEPRGALAQAKYRLGDSRFWIGLGYVRASTKVGFAESTTSLSMVDKWTSEIGGVMPSITYDSRDNIFTPNRGLYAEITPSLYSQAFGGNDEFQRLDLIGMQYWPLDPTWILGLRGNAALSFGDVPFYMRPFIALRGVPVMRYQGEQTAQIEAELRWQCWQRFSLVGFTGVGAAWNDHERFDNLLKVTTGGLGFRYEIARKYDLHMGLDLAFGPEDPAIYVQFGSAWLRP